MNQWKTNLSLKQFTGMWMDGFVWIKNRRKIFLLAIGFFILSALTLPTVFINYKTQSQVARNIEDVPARKVCLLLGTDRMRATGETNFHFEARINAVVQLFQEKKIQSVIISGHGDNKGFDEPEEMKKELLAKGISEQSITLDKGGLRTIQAAARARDIHHLTDLTLVTDGFHAHRAAFLFQHFGMNAVVYCAEEEPGIFWPVFYGIRELIARSKAVFDVICLGIGS